VTFRETFMKKLIPLLLAFLLLAGCSEGAGQSDAQMQTQVAQILTEMAPTMDASLIPAESSPTLPVPDILIETLPEGGETPVPTSTSELPPTFTPLPTDTPVPSDTPTLEFSKTPMDTVEPSATLYPTFTPPPTDPRIKLGAAAWTDTMTGSGNWATDTDKFTKLSFKESFMQLTGLTTSGGWRLAGTPDIPNMYLEMTVKTGECTGRDYYGLIFRVPVKAEADRGYLFGVSCDGQYSLFSWDGKVQPEGKTIVLVSWRNSLAIDPGSGKTNRIAVQTKSDKISLYANGVLLWNVTDKAYPNGYFGVFVNPDTTAKFTVYIDEISYWLLNP
jgi:hypothetical protein